MRQKVIRLYHLEDDDNDALLVARALKQTAAPCTLQRFPNPPSAIAALESIVAPELEAPHLILCDLKMPLMSGIEFTCWLRHKSRRFQFTPVIILTGSALAGDLLAAYRCGANSFATKPTTAHHLNEIVGTVLKYWGEVCNIAHNGDVLATGADGLAQV